MAARSYDAIVIGAGHNGLVAGAYLARAGWSVAVLERDELAGGAVRSEELTLPGVIHDTFATNMNLFRASPVAAELGAELERHGLAYATCEQPFANVFPDGSALRIHQGLEATLEELRGHDPRDASGWQELDALYERLAPALFGVYASRMALGPLLRAGRAAAPALRGGGAAELARLALSSPRELSESHLASREARAILPAWGMHLDFGPDVAGGAVFPFLEAFSDMRAGISIVRGGASRLTDALVALLREAGGELRTQADVARVLVTGARAGGVELADGERLFATRAVIANLTPSVLYGRLLAQDEVVPAPVRRAAAGFAYGPATMMVHLALSGPVPWRAGGDLARFAYVHVAPYADDLARNYAQALAGLLPAEPLLVVGQTSAVDPTRSAGGAEAVWVQVRALPSRIAGDSLGQISARTWREAAAPYADRVIAKLERYAPGVTDRVRGRTVLTPAELEARNPNLVGGDSLAGSMHLRQNFALRPFAAARDYESGVPGLLMVGASTWPGAGVNALSGYNAAHKLLAPAGRGARLLPLAGELRAAAGGWIRSRLP